MLKLRAEQLHFHLNKNLNTIYLLFGNDFFLLKESQDTIHQVALAQGFKELYTFHIEKDTDWQAIFSICHTISLFTVRKILKISLPENNSLNSIIDRNLTKLISLLHNDILLIIKGNNFTKIRKNTAWFKQLVNHSILVICQTPEKKDLKNWIFERARNKQLQLDDSICHFLCRCYEGNLLGLTQALEKLALLWPKEKLSLLNVRQVVNDATHFTPFDWVNAILLRKSKRSLYILQQFYLESKEPVILIRTLQNELLLLLILKRQSISTSLTLLFNKYCIWQNRRSTLKETINNLSENQLHKAIQLLTRIELTLKQNFQQSVWQDLKSITLLLCHKSLADIFIND